MNAHRVKVFNRTNDYNVVLAVTHNLKLILFPADNRFLNKNLSSRAKAKAPGDVLLELFHVISDVSAHAAQRIRWTNNRRKANMLKNFLGLFPRMCKAATWNFKADIFDDLFETVSFFSPLDRAKIRTEHFDFILFQHTTLCKSNRGIQASLSTKSWQQAIGLFFADDLFDHRRSDRLNVCPPCQLRIGHDRRRITVDQDNLVAFAHKSFTSLRT